jgi:hypothetical protein
MTIKCHFDGKVFVPDEAVNLPTNQPLLLRIDPGVVIVEPSGGGKGTVGDLLPFVGIWKNRTDIRDSTEFVQELRRRAQHQLQEEE